MRDDILQIRAPALNFYVLKDASGLYILDGGFIGGRALLSQALRQRGWENEPIRGVIVTHGHLDHILNVAAISHDFDAWIAAPRLDSDHYAGHPHYRGWARVTGVLETLGRAILPFKPFVPTRLLDDGDVLDVWQGLRAVHLPGHTLGHMGFYCERLKLLFCGDLFSSYRLVSGYPAAIFNSKPEIMPRSVETALGLDLDGIIPNHCDSAGPEEHLLRLRRLHQRKQRKLT